MADRKPPKLSGGERETLVALLQYQRDSLVRKVTGVDEDDARRSFVDSGTTLLWLMRHMALAEHVWVLHRFAGDDGPLPSDEVRADDTLASAVDAYRAMWSRVDAVVAAVPTLDQVGAEAPVNLRWVLAHLLEETARHAGHADIIRELLDGQTGR